MDAQFIAAALEAACHPHVSKRVETYAIGLAISEKIGRPLLEYQIDGPGFGSPEYGRAFRFAAYMYPPHQRGRREWIATGLADYVWVLIEGNGSPSATLHINLGGAQNDLATDYPASRTVETVGWLDIPTEIDCAIRDLIAAREEMAA